MADVLGELRSVLESVRLYARGFERSLCDTRWATEAGDLRSAAERAVELAANLQHKLPE